MTAQLAAAAAAAADGVLVARPRTDVVHVACPGGAGLTATGRLRRGHRPLCGTRGRAWPTLTALGATGGARRLCVRCTAALRRKGVDLTGRDIAARLTPDQITDLVDHARTDHDLHVAVMALCNCHHPGLLARLAPRVRARRDRLHPPETRMPVTTRSVSEQGVRRARA